MYKENPMPSFRHRVRFFENILVVLSAALLLFLAASAWAWIISAGLLFYVNNLGFLIILDDTDNFFFR